MSEDPFRVAPIAAIAFLGFICVAFIATPGHRWRASAKPPHTGSGSLLPFANPEGYYAGIVEIDGGRIHIGLDLRSKGSVVFSSQIISHSTFPAAEIALKSTAAVLDISDATWERPLLSWGKINIFSEGVQKFELSVEPNSDLIMGVIRFSKNALTPVSQAQPAPLVVTSP